MTFKHGYAGKIRSPMYFVWQSMLARCRNVKNKGYYLYGGRGISVCKRWTKFENFLADMGQKPRGKSIDRINNNGNYCPSNCRWATPSEQSANSRQAKLVLWKGIVKPINAWAPTLGVTSSALFHYARNHQMKVQDVVLSRLMERDA